jgi:hypothetical protein
MRTHKHDAKWFSNRLRLIGEAAEKDPERFRTTIEALLTAKTGGVAAAREDDDDDDDDDDEEIDWGLVAFIGIMILTL